MTVVNSFNINNQRHPNSNEFIINEIRTEPEFTYHIFRDGESILTDYNFDYYIDPTVVSGNNYCYIIELIDSDGSVIITSDESCILYDPDNITPGDITHDQLVNILDVVMIVDYIINNILPTNFELLAADLNQDFILDVVDLVLLVDLILSQWLIELKQTHFIVKNSENWNFSFSQIILHTQHLTFTGREKYVHEFKNFNMKQKLPKTEMTCREHFHAGYYSG